MARRTAKEEVKVTIGSGNVFRDLGFEDADALLAKSGLVFALSRAIESCGITQAKLAEQIGIDQPAVSKLLRGRTEGYSIERLINILNSLGYRVDVRVEAMPGAKLPKGWTRERVGKVGWALHE